MRNVRNLLVIAVLFTALTSCRQAKKETVNQEEKKEIKSCDAVKWSHTKGENGPENWKNLCDGFSDCSGKSQSPINIVTSTATAKKDFKAPKVSYEASTIKILNNDHTVKFKIEGNNKANINGKNYDLLQLHYHALSEHTIDGKYFPIEVHLVHKHSDSDFAVIGVMFEEGKPNEVIATLLKNLPEEGKEVKLKDKLDFTKLLPSEMSFYHYSGSLTTPPCSEVVSWFVAKKPVTASKEQIEQFSKILENNYRPIQSLNGRKLFSVE